MQYEQVVTVYCVYCADYKLQITNCKLRNISNITGYRLQITDFKFQVIGLMLKNISEIKNSRKLLNALTLKLIVLLLLKFTMDLFSKCGYSCLQLLMPLISID